MPSPIEQMIDAAAGYDKRQTPIEPPPLSMSEQREIAAEAGNAVIWYIDQQYPEMWENVPKSARTSIKNTVYNRVMSILKNKPA